MFDSALSLTRNLVEVNPFHLVKRWFSVGSSLSPSIANPTKSSKPNVPKPQKSDLRSSARTSRVCKSTSISKPFFTEFHEVAKKLKGQDGANKTKLQAYLLQLWSEVISESPSLTTSECNIMISFLGLQKRQHEDALELFQMMQQSSSLQSKGNSSNRPNIDPSLHPNIIPNTVTYNTILTIYMQAGQYEKVIDLFRKSTATVRVRNVSDNTPDNSNTCSKTTSLKPNLITCNIVLSAYARLERESMMKQMANISKPEVATAALLLALSFLREEMPNSYSVKPDLLSYNTVLSMKGLGYDEMRNLLQEIESEDGLRPDLINLSSCIAACERSGRWREAMEILKEKMPKYNIKPDVMSFNSAISACEKACGSILRPGSTISTNSIISGRPNSEISTVSSETSESRETGLREVRYKEESTISSTRDENRGTVLEIWEKALELFREMPKFGLKPNVITFNAIITLCGNIGKWQQALRIYEEEMHSYGAQPDTITKQSLITAVCGNITVLRGGLHDVHRYDTHDAHRYAVGLHRYAVGIRLYRDVDCEPLYEDKIKSDGRIDILDLHKHDLGTATVACLYQFLQSVLTDGAHSSSKSEKDNQKRDLHLIVGKGLHSPKEAILRTEIPLRLHRFFNFSRSEAPRYVPGNEGRLLITSGTLKKIRESAFLQRLRVAMEK